MNLVILGALGAAGTVGAASGASIAAPQVVQNFAFSGTSAPHLVQKGKLSPAIRRLVLPYKPFSDVKDELDGYSLSLFLDLHLMICYRLHPDFLPVLPFPEDFAVDLSL